MACCIKRFRFLSIGLAVLLVVALAAPQAWAWYQLREARTALAQYHPEKAVRSLSECERVWGGRASVHLLASRAARQSGDLEAANRELRESQRLSGSTEETAFEWALLQAASGNIGEVEEYLQKRTNKSPDQNALIWEALAEGYLRVYRTLDAMTCLNHWLELDKDNVRALELRGMTFVTGKGVMYGARDYRSVLAMDPSRQKTRWRLVGCLMDMGGYDEAAEHLEILGRESPNDPDVAARLARCFIMLRRGDEAKRLLEEALRAHPDHGLCLRTLGQFALSSGKPDEAEPALRRAVSILSDDYQSNWLLFQSLQQQGKLDEAKTQLARAESLKDRNEHLSELTSRKLAENPLDPGIQYEFGTILMREGQARSALQWFESALKLDPNHGPTHAALADYYEKNGDKLKAEEHRQKAKASVNPSK